MLTLIGLIAVVYVIYRGITAFKAWNNGSGPFGHM